jgi:hypothetical protein
VRVTLAQPVLVSFAFVVGTAVHIAALAAPASRTVEKLVKTSPGQELTIRLDSGGSLRVRGDNVDAVRLRARLPRSSWRNFVVILAATTGGVRLDSAMTDSSSSDKRADFELRVPRRYNISLDSAGGRVDIIDIEGTLRGTISGGMITIIHAHGRAELATTAGAVRVFDSNLSGFITTGGGSIELKRVTGGLNAALDRSVHPTASDSGSPGRLR